MLSGTVSTMLRFALQNLCSRPLRSLLALFGLTVAIAGMVGLLSIAAGIDSVVAGTFGRIPGIVVMQRGAPIPLVSRLPASWAEEARKIPGVNAVHSEVWIRAHLINGKPTISPPRFLFGIHIPDNQRLLYSPYRDSLKSGRFLQPEDAATNNAVVSKAICDQYNVSVGQSLLVDGQRFEIVGVYETGSILLDVAILLDNQIVRSMARFPSDTINSFYVEPSPGVERETLMAELSNLYRGRSADGIPSSTEWELLQGAGRLEQILQTVCDVWRTFTTPRAKPAAKPDESPAAEPGESPAESPPADPTLDRSQSASDSPATANRPAAATQPSGDESLEDALPVELRGSNEWASEFQKFSADLDIFLWIMTIIGITIATLGIVNTMMMSVFERTIEFGILRANGWTARDVVWLITLESLLLGIAAGLLGDVVGWTATHVVNAIYRNRAQLEATPGLLLFSFLFSVVLGAAGGIYPAIWAARKQPMAAIRRD
jgi:putative ABC transport system permease protein